MVIIYNFTQKHKINRMFKIFYLYSLHVFSRTTYNHFKR